MLPTEDQKRLKFNSKIGKDMRAYPLKAVAGTVGMIGFIALPSAFLVHPALVAIAPIAFFVQWRLMIKAAKVYGPYLGNDAGRAHKATLDDARRGRLT